MEVLEITRFYFFFFKQKTAYEMLRSLVGSEMCIRDRCGLVDLRSLGSQCKAAAPAPAQAQADPFLEILDAVSYTHLTLPTIYSV